MVVEVDQRIPHNDRRHRGSGVRHRGGVRREEEGARHGSPRRIESVRREPDNFADELQIVFRADGGFEVLTTGEVASCANTVQLSDDIRDMTGSFSSISYNYSNRTYKAMIGSLGFDDVIFQHLKDYGISIRDIRITNELRRVIGLFRYNFVYLPKKSGVWSEDVLLTIGFVAGVLKYFKETDITAYESLIAPITPSELL